MHISGWMERIDLQKEIQEVYLHSFLFKLGVRLVGIFLPFYILELGYGIPEVFIFFVIYSSAYILLTWVNAYITSKLGYKHTSLVASIPILLFYLLLRSASSRLEVFALAFLGGTAFNLYWMGMNPETASSSHNESRDKETGFFFSMPSLASIFSPVVGGLILALFSFKVLFLVSALLVGASFLPFFLTREHYSGLDLELRKFLSDADFNDFYAFFFRGFNSMGKKMFWPLYLAIIVGGSINIGGAGSFIALGSAVTSVAIGKVVNENNRRTVIMTGFSIASLTYLAMSAVTTPLYAFLISLINGLSYNAGIIPVYSHALDHAEEEDLIEYFAAREMALAFGRMSFLIIGFILFQHFNQSLSFLMGFILLSNSVLITGHFGSKM